MAGYAMSGRPASEGQYFGLAFTPKQPAAAGEMAGRSARTSDFDGAAAGAQRQKYQWYLDGGRTGRLGERGRADRLRCWAMCLRLGQFSRLTEKDAESSAKGTVKERVKSVELADRLDPVAGGVRQGLYSADVVGYVDVNVRATNLGPTR